MAATEELHSFVRDALSRGLPRAEVERALLAAGWPADQVSVALASFAEVEFPVPVPRPRPYLTAREAFLYLMLFSSLYVSAFNLGHLVFQLINHALPDPAGPPPPRAAEMIREGIRWSIATLLVAFPVFLYMARLTGREVSRDPDKRASKIRRWLTYLTLFIAGAVIIGDVTSLVYNLLGGELTTRFTLKVLTIGAISGSIFLYFVRDLRSDERERQPGETRIFAGAAVAAVAVAMIGGAIVMGSPGTQRAMRQDARRVEDLRGIALAADLYFTRNNRLPASLAEMESERGVTVSTTDPAGRAYEYRVAGARGYELCADFQLAHSYQATTALARRAEIEAAGAPAQAQAEPPRDTTRAGQRSRAPTAFWSHGAGRQCFEMIAESVAR